MTLRTMMPTEIDERRALTAANIGALTLSNAMIFHCELSESESRVKPLHELLENADPLKAIADHWLYIIEKIDYVPIFKLAREILQKLPRRKESREALKKLFKDISEIVAQRAALRHDLMGRIYHRLLLEAKYLGTYYTSVPTATFLLKLALAPSSNSLDWSNTSDIGKLRIADLASGTGTLLMAANQAIVDNFVHALAGSGKKVGEKELAGLHKILIEEVLHGYDVLTSAVHLTASTLSLLAPQIAFEKMNLWVLPHGRLPNGDLALGSIEYARRSSVAVQLDLMGLISAEGTSKAVTGKGERASLAPLPDLDLCVMNPPFTRSAGANLLFGSLPKAERTAMQTELKKILNPPGNDPSTKLLASSTAGLGSVFTAVGDQHIKPGGRIALVLPVAVTSGVAWQKTRALFDKNYILERLVVSHDPKQWNFSENTSLSEALVIGRKKKPNERSIGQVQCVNLWKNLKTSIDALAASEAVLNTLGAELDHQGSAGFDVGGSKAGEVISYPWSEMQNDIWMPIAFAQTDMVRVAYHLRKGKVFIPGLARKTNIPMTLLGKLGTLGPDRRDIHDGFSIGDSQTSYPAVWGHKAEEMVTLSIQPNKYLTPLSKAKPGRKLRSVNILWPRAGRVFIAERIRLNTQATVAVRMGKKGLSNVWWPMHIGSGTMVEKSLVLWLNSSLGLTSFLSYRESTEGAWVDFKKPVLTGMVVPDFMKLSARKLSSLGSLYDKLALSEIATLPNMATDPVRKEIDRGIEEAFGLPSVKVVREALAREPFVCLKGL